MIRASKMILIGLSLRKIKNLAAWKSHYENLFNEEFPWDPDSLSTVDPVQGPPPYVSIDMVKTAVDKIR